NLFIVLTLGSILAVFDWLDRLQRRQISAGNTALILCLFAAASLVKYAYLPIALGLGGIMLWQLWKARKQRSELSADFLASIKALPRWQLVGIGMLFILSAGLFAERYGINMVKYHTPNPDCAQVLSVSSCLQYSPWARDYQLV